MPSNQIEIIGSAPTAGYSYVFGRFQLKIAENGKTTLFSEGHAVALTTVALTVLRVLLENHGSYVKTKQLLDSVLK
jgi:DNA-binding winged helix-turn-helix (wHTH) protein